MAGFEVMAIELLMTAVLQKQKKLQCVKTQNIISSKTLKTRRKSNSSNQNGVYDLAKL